MTRKFWIIAFACIFMPLTAPAFAAGAGYEGLIAPDTPEKGTPKASPPAASSGYEGVLAPAPQPNRGGRAEEPVGYSGVIPGRVKDPQLMSHAPGKEPGKLDLPTAALLYSTDKDGDGVPDALVRPEVTYNGDPTITGEDGKSRMETALAGNISYYMNQLKDKSLSRTETEERGRKTYQELSDMAYGLRLKKAIPDSTYLQMGLTQAYVDQKKASVEKSLSMVEKQLEELSKYK